jgi:hypothetical protein
MTQSYLPEWQLYLLKKLVLDAKALNSRSLVARDFIYVNSSEAREAVEESLHQEMQYINSIPNRIYAGEKLQETLTSISLSRGYSPPEFKSIEILQALIEWSGEPDAPIQFKKITISKDYFNTQEKKRIASISSGHPPFSESKGRNMVSVSEGTLKNGMKELPKDPFEVGTLKDILVRNPNLADHIVFQLEIDVAKINKKIDAYLDDFSEQKLIPSKGSRYFTVEEQRARFLGVIGELERKYGKNVATNFREIIQMIGRGSWREESCRFYETMFLLEKEGVIKIVELRGLEIVFAAIQDLSVKTEEVERFNLEKEFAKVQRIKDETQHRLVQENWQNVGFILGEIIKVLPPLKSRLPQVLSLDTKTFSEAQKKALRYVMEYLLEIGGIEMPPAPKPVVVITSEPLRKVLDGEYAIVGNQDAIEEYAAQIYELCDLIKKDAKAKFAKRDLSSLSESSKKKILGVLEIIHSRYELTPQKPQWQNHGITATMGDGGGKMRIATREFFSVGDINFYELEGILGVLKNDGLLNNFEFLSEYQ